MNLLVLRNVVGNGELGHVRHGCGILSLVSLHLLLAFNHRLLALP